MIENKKYIARLSAGFRGVKFMPKLYAWGHNNLNPKLILLEDHIEYRGAFRIRKALYQEIEKIDVFIWNKRTNNIVITKTTSIFTFIGNFKMRKQLQDCLKIFYNKGCILPPNALKEMEQSLSTEINPNGNQK